MATLLENVDVAYRKKLTDKVLRKTCKGSFCWEWTGGAKKGSTDCYGYLYVHGKYTGAHRLAYALFVEDFSAELQVLHGCDNPRCVNPSHLFLGTNLDNQQDRARKFRGPRKLKVEDVVRVHELNAGGWSQYKIAHEIGIRQSCVRDVLTGATYQHRPRPESYRINLAKGEENARAKLTEDGVREIKSLIALGVPYKTIAKKFGVWVTTIYAIRDGKTWRHVT